MWQFELKLVLSKNNFTCSCSERTYIYEKTKREAKLELQLKHIFWSSNRQPVSFSFSILGISKWELFV